LVFTKGTVVLIDGEAHVLRAEREMMCVRVDAVLEHKLVGVNGQGDKDR